MRGMERGKAGRPENNPVHAEPNLGDIKSESAVHRELPVSEYAQAATL